MAGEQRPSSHQLTDTLQKEAFAWETLIKKQLTVGWAHLWASAGRGAALTQAAALPGAATCNARTGTCFSDQRCTQKPL